MNILACTGRPDLEVELQKYCLVQSVKVVDEILDVALNWRPDAVLLSLYLPSYQTDITEVCRELRRNGLRVVVLCGDNPELALSLFEIGIHDFIVGSRITVHKVIQCVKNPMSVSDAAKIFQGFAPSRQAFVRQVDQIPPGEGYWNSNQTVASRDPGYHSLKKQEKPEEEYQGPPVIGFWGIKPGSGTGSIARAVALSASNLLKVLLVETDFRYPSAMFSLKMIDEERCMEKAIQAIQEGTGSVSNCILNKRNNKNRPEVPDGLNLLAPSIERGLELFPKIEGEDTFFKIHESLKDDYDLIIYDLASELDSYLTIGAMKQCSHLLVVIDGRPACMAFLEKRLNLLKRLKIKAVEDCAVVTNKLPGEVGMQKIQQITGLKVAHNIPYDREMSDAVMNMLPGGKVFIKSVEELCVSLGIVGNAPKKTSEPAVWMQLKGGNNKKWALNKLFSTTR